jgi:hypothetical protein
MSPSVLLMETSSSPPKHEKYCVDISHPGRTRMQYVTHRLHRMQRHKSNVMCPSRLFVKSVPVQPEYEK